MKHFRTLLTLVAIVTASLYAYCEPLVLEPPFKEGQTLKYLITTDVILSSEEAGSKEASISTELQIDVVKTNDNGTVMITDSTNQRWKATKPPICRNWRER